MLLRANSIRAITGTQRRIMTSQAGSFASLFDAQAAAYAAYRFQYPPELYENIVSFITPGCNRVAVDIASGSGQAAKGLAKHFHSVIALDANREQLKNAPSIESVEFRYGLAEDTGIESNSADLVTTAQALHWFDLPAFYTEARRILQPKGSLAVWGYGVLYFDHEEADAAIDKFYTKDIGPYWSDRRKLIDQHYAGMEPGPEHFGVVQRSSTDMRKDFNRKQLLGYLSTWSAYHTYLKKHRGGVDPLESLKTALISALDWEDEEKVISIRVPVFMILAKEPVKE